VPVCLEVWPKVVENDQDDVLHAPAVLAGRRKRHSGRGNVTTMPNAITILFLRRRVLARAGYIFGRFLMRTVVVEDAVRYCRSGDYDRSHCERGSHSKRR